MIFSTFPNYEPVNAQNMNYSIVVMSGWLMFRGVYYYTGGNHRYVEPSKIARRRFEEKLLVFSLGTLPVIDEVESVSSKLYWMVAAALDVYTGSPGGAE